jgi:hypothetical protein
MVESNSYCLQGDVRHDSKGDSDDVTPNIAAICTDVSLGIATQITRSAPQMPREARSRPAGPVPLDKRLGGERGSLLTPQQWKRGLFQHGKADSCG